MADDLRWKLKPTFRYEPPPQLCGPKPAMTLLRMDSGKLCPRNGASMHRCAAVEIDPKAGRHGEVRIVFRLQDVDFTTQERMRREVADQQERDAALDRIPLALTGLHLPLTLPGDAHAREITPALVAELAADLAEQLPGLLAAALGVPVGA